VSYQKDEKLKIEISSFFSLNVREKSGLWNVIKAIYNQKA